MNRQYPNQLNIAVSDKGLPFILWTSLFALTLLLVSTNCLAASTTVQQQRLQQLSQVNNQTQQAINSVTQAQQQQQQQVQQTLQDIGSNKPNLASIPSTKTPPASKKPTTHTQQQPSPNNNQATDVTGFANPSDTQQQQNNSWNYGF